ncbi:MAG: type II toxin-antitoxin system HicA family toxin [Gallionella sp.]
MSMKRKHIKTLALLFHRPVSANVKHDEVIALLIELGAQIEISREGSRVGVVMFGEVRVLHKPHPSPSMDKGAVASVRDWLEQHGVTP